MQCIGQGNFHGEIEREVCLTGKHLTKNRNIKV